MWDIKLELVHTDSKVVVTRGKGVGVVKGKRGQIHGNRR